MLGVLRVEALDHLTARLAKPKWVGMGWMRKKYNLKEEVRLVTRRDEKMNVARPRMTRTMSYAVTSLNKAS
jgi:hypothetical protein